MTAALSVDHTLQIGAQFGPYSVVRVLGSGGMGTVYEARHNTLGKRVAIKTLHRAVAMKANLVERFVREGQAASRINHPNVVQVSDVGVVDGIPYLVMEFLEGEDLAAKIEREKKLSLEETLKLVLPIVGAVHAAHEAGIIHRDIKPENILLGKGRGSAIVPKLLDFGISKLNDTPNDHQLTQTTSFMGTPFYMSPEQARGAKSVSTRADQYSLGVVLYECLVGDPPFVDETLFGLVHRIASGQFEPLRKLRPDVPAAVEAAVHRAMASSPDHRWATAAQLGAALLPYADAKTQAVCEQYFASLGTTAQINVPFGATLREVEAVSGTEELASAPTMAAHRVATDSHSGVNDVHSLKTYSSEVSSGNTPMHARYPSSGNTPMAHYPSSGSTPTPNTYSSGNTPLGGAYPSDQTPLPSNVQNQLHQYDQQMAGQPLKARTVTTLSAATADLPAGLPRKGPPVALLAIGGLIVVAVGFGLAIFAARFFSGAPTPPTPAFVADPPPRSNVIPNITPTPRIENTVTDTATGTNTGSGATGADTATGTNTGSGATGADTATGTNTGTTGTGTTPRRRPGKRPRLDESGLPVL